MKYVRWATNTSCPVMLCPDGDEDDDADDDDDDDADGVDDEARDDTRDLHTSKPSLS